MDVLEVSRKLIANPSIELLIGALKDHSGIGDVQFGVEQFWKKSCSVDIAHFHWPEALFYWKPPNHQKLANLVLCLQDWNKNARLIATVHNRFPHYRDTEMSRHLYEAVYSHMDGFIHRGKSSMDEMKEAHPNLNDIPHTIIPAGIPVNFPNNINKVEARRQLKLDNPECIFLSFGDMRHIEEGEQILNGFQLSKSGNTRLMIICRKNHGTRAQTVRRQIFRARTLLDSRVRFQVGQVPNQQVQVFVNAADVLVISRLQILNSANLQLGFAFGKVVVGPDTGVVGEVLRQTGNPVFTPGNNQSVAAALDQGYRLSVSGHGEHNRAFAQQHWNWGLIANQHVNFFNSVINS